MKILLIGSNEVYAIENFFKKHIQSSPEVEEVKLLAVNEYIRKYLNLFHKIERRLSPSINFLYTKLNCYIIRQVESFQPDAILVFKGMELYPSTIKNFRTKGILLANFNPDHPFIFSSRGSGNYNIKASLRLYNIHFCYSIESVKMFTEKYNVHSVFLPFGFELPDNCDTSLSEEEILGVCFIGTADRNRYEIINRILREGITVYVYGSNWNKFYPKNIPKKLIINNPVYGRDFWATMRKYRIQLNIFRPHNIGSHNMRTFELPSAGAIMLAPDSEEHRLFFQNNKEIFLYSSSDEMIEKIKYLLGLPKEEVFKIRKAAMNKGMNPDYSYFNRANTIVKNLKMHLKVLK